MAKNFNNKLRKYRRERRNMIGAKIKEYLTQNGIKQTFLAEKTGLSDSIISDICTKNRKIDCIEYYKICKVLNVPLETFLEDEE